MKNRCPRCGEKLSLLYLKQTCPKCGANLLYCDFEKRLEEDHAEAMRQEALATEFLDRLKLSSVKGPVQIIRLAALLLPILLTLLPVFKTNAGANLSLLSFVMGLVGGSLSLGQIKGDPACLYPFVFTAAVILTSLAAAIASLFSTDRAALVRNILFSAAGLAAGLVLTALSRANGASVRAGAVLILLDFALQIFLHKSADRKIRAKTAEKQADPHGAAG